VYSNRDIPKIAYGEVLVKVAFAALNPVDFKLANNDFSFPRVVGLDVAGFVHQVNDDEQKYVKSTSETISVEVSTLTRCRRLFLFVRVSTGGKLETE
jgi:NADPH:quinone reductase-like Zn-dependent oxidoreductase